ncbi:hypothetical protein I553_10361 [Mycobacterium xenopi 4042]|uniref:Uncharacterized protein n=1 Tax=Mycobacterium xenopi 4042 TaxID=1299334 RepID=X7ZKH8_MYCXE|nr:hypothetical protein I553_10361 [Mycobacterium xenopi 4042]
MAKKLAADETCCSVGLIISERASLSPRQLCSNLIRPTCLGFLVIR